MLSKSSIGQLGFVHYIAKFTISRFEFVFHSKKKCLSLLTSSSRVSCFSRAKALGWKNFVQERSKMMTISDCNMILSELLDRLTNDNCKVFKSKIFTLQNWYFKTFLGRMPECIFVGMAIIKNLLLSMQFCMSKKVM